jgi:hypothetical protein
VTLQTKRIHVLRIILFKKNILDCLVLQWPVLLAACGGHETYALPTFCIYHKYNYLIVLSRKQTITHHHSHSLYYICFKTKKSRMLSSTEQKHATPRPITVLFWKVTHPRTKMPGMVILPWIWVHSPDRLKARPPTTPVSASGMFIKFHIVLIVSHGPPINMKTWPV